MKLNALSPRIACLLLMVALIAVARENAAGAGEEKDVGENRVNISEARLQSHLMSFADRFVSNLDTVIAQFERLGPQGASRYEVLELLTLSAHHAYIIAGGSEPKIGLLDMFSMVTLGRIFFEEEGAKRYGNVVAPVLEGFRRAEAGIREVAARELSARQMKGLMTIIANWRRNNPEVKSFPLIRFSNFAADRQDSSLTRAETPEGLFKSVEQASETVEDMRLLAERGVYMATRIPQLTGLFGDLWLTRWLNTPDMLTARTDLRQLAQGTGQLASELRGLPDQIKKEREAVIREFMAQVEKERRQAIEQLVSGIAGQRQAALEEIIAEERAIEARLSAQFVEMVQRFEHQSKHLVDYTLRWLAFLLLLVLIGYIAAGLLVRYVSARFPVSGR
jgi:hypothetical protein